jgi:hypothetical protein
MRRPAYAYAFGGPVEDHLRDPATEKRRADCTPAEDAMARVSWLADNFHYSSYEQAQEIARDVIDILRAMAPTSTRSKA